MYAQATQEKGQNSGNNAFVAGYWGLNRLLWGILRHFFLQKVYMKTEWRIITKYVMYFT